MERQRRKQVTEMKEKQGEKLEQQRVNKSELDHKHKRDTQQLLQKQLTKGDSHSESRQRLLTFQQEMLRQQNESRQKVNQENVEQQKAALDSIKERIWRKHKRVQARKQRMQHDRAPPTTFQIYHQSTNSIMMNSNLFSTAASVDTKSHTPVKPRNQAPANNTLSFRNPLADFGMQEAYESSILSFGGGLSRKPRTAPGGGRRA